MKTIEDLCALCILDMDTHHVTGSDSVDGENQSIGWWSMTDAFLTQYLSRKTTFRLDYGNPIGLFATATVKGTRVCRYHITEMANKNGRLS